MTLTFNLTATSHDTNNTSVSPDRQLQRYHPAIAANTTYGTKPASCFSSNLPSIRCFTALTSVPALGPLARHFLRAPVAVHREHGTVAQRVFPSIESARYWRTGVAPCRLLALTRVAELQIAVEN